MSNEELVFLIQQGRLELSEQLLKQNHGFLVVMANRYRSFVKQNCGCGDFSDLMQAASLGMLNAVSDWDQERGAFITFAKFGIMREIRALLGVSSTKQRIENVMPPVSLYATLNDETNTMLVETLADEAAMDPGDAAEEALTRRLMQNAVDSLPEEQRTLITRCTLGGQSLQAYSDRRGVPIEECHRLRNKAFRALRRDKRLKWLREEYETSVFRHKGLSAFQSSWSSAVEDAAIRREQLLARVDEIILALGDADVSNLVALRDRLHGMA